jgi:hypothetical protein
MILKKASNKCIDKSSLIFILLSVLIILYISLILNNYPRDVTIDGSWDGEDENISVSINFKSDSTCSINILNKASGLMELIEGSYFMDTKKNPIPLTIRNSKQLTHAIHTIIEFQSHDSLRISYFSAKEKLRPLSFSKNGSLYIGKQKSK